MVDLVELQYIAYITQIIGVAGILIAAFIAVRSYINTNKRAEESKKKEQETRDRELETRQAQLLMGVYQALVSPEMMEANLKLQDIEMEDVQDWNRLCKNKDRYKVWMLWASYYQGLGTLAEEKLIDVSLLAQLLGGNILWFWEQYGSMMVDCRGKLSWPGWGKEIEYLYNGIYEYGVNHPESGLGDSGRQTRSPLK